MLKTQKKPILNTIALSVVAVTFLVAGIAMAQGPGQGMGGKKGGFDRFDRMASRLELNADQKTAIKALQEDSREANQSLRKDMMRLRNELQGEMMKDEPSEKTVLGISAKMSDIKGEQRANRLKTRLAVRKHLTPEQRDQMMLMGGQGQGNGKGHGQKGAFQGKGQGNGNAGSGCRQGGGGSQRNCR
jgi:Spy/CpxP family protein refolding chaperone